MIIKIDEKDNGRRLKEYLGHELGFSMKLLRRVKFTDGGLEVNGAHVTVRYILKTGDILAVNFEDNADDMNPYTVPASLPIDVIYEDGDLTVVNKPAGMPAHPSLGHKDDTVANALAYRYSDKPYVFRPVNRLDRDTSGVMITANNRVAAFRLYKQMMAGNIRKRYIAVLGGILPDADGEIVSYIRRREESIMERVECSPDEDGAKIAVTRYATVAEADGYSIVVAEPVTGRTHQLRVHFASRGCQIVGDDMYGTPSEYISRHALHAVTTVIPHPTGGEVMTVRAPLPADIRSLITKLFGADTLAKIENEEL